MTEPGSLEELRSRLAPEDEDVLSIVEPTKPSELRALTDDELFRMLRKVAFANLWRVSDKVQFEATARLMRHSARLSVR